MHLANKSIKDKKSFDILTPVGDLLMITSYNSGAKPKNLLVLNFKSFFSSLLTLLLQDKCH